MPVPLEFPGGYLLAAVASAAAVALVVLAAAVRAVREPVDSLLRAVPSRKGGAGAGVAEVVLIVFSLTAVVALVTGNLEGPLATLAPTLLAVAAGLLLGARLAPATLATSRWLLRRGRAVAAAGIVNAVRRPAARRVLVMVVVATALLVFCVDALVTGQQIRQNAAEQQNGAPYSLDVDTSSLDAVVAALAEADPDHEHLTASRPPPCPGSARVGPTVAVDSAAFPRVAYFPLSDPGRAPWAAITAPAGRARGPGRGPRSRARSTRRASWPAAPASGGWPRWRSRSSCGSPTAARSRSPWRPSRRRATARCRSPRASRARSRAW